MDQSSSLQKISVIYLELEIVLKEVFGVRLNLQKPSLLALQFHSVVGHVSFMEQTYQQLPELRLIPLAAKGFVILGVPIGTDDFVNDAI